MPANLPIPATLRSPLATVGRGTLEVLAYLGGLGILPYSALRSLIRAGDHDSSVFADFLRQIASCLLMGIPLVALVHVGIGSFLSMQAYFGGTFVDGTGAVVGVGLIRNMAPLMTGMTLAGLFAARMTSELRGRARSEATTTRPVRLGSAAHGSPDNLAQLAAVRLAAAFVVGPVLTFWGVVVGTLVGWQVAQTILGVSTDSFFSMFLEMLWVRDVIGLLVKGTAFALFAALAACHEGLRGPAEPAPELVPAAACRAACVASIAILFLNSGWFLLVYHAGPAFGPTLLAPPTT